MLNFEKYALEYRYIVIDHSFLPNQGSNIERASFIPDHNLGRSVLSFCILTFTFLLDKTFTPLTLPIGLAKTIIPKSPEEKVGSPRSICGQMSYGYI